MLKNIKDQKSQWIIILLFLGLIGFPIFLHLDSKPLREWDEARNAINAFEMGDHYNVLVKTFDDQPDLWETKPPLLEWLQAIGFHLLGVNELAVRLPSALATLCLVLFLPYFFKRHFNLPMAGIFASLILLTSHGYVFEHCTRTGDHDALLVCFEMMMLSYFFLYTTHKNIRYLAYCSVFLVLCVYTKSAACFLLMPGILVYLLYSRQFISSIKDRKLWTGFILAITACLLYYIAREYSARGYLSAVWENELFPRYFNTAKTYQYNPRDPSFYFLQIYHPQFSYWYLFILPAIVVNEIFSDGLLKKFHRYLMINAAVFLLVLSNGTTNSSYLLPLLPMLSILIGISICLIGTQLFKRLPFKQYTKHSVLCILAIALFIKPYSSVINEIMDISDNNTQVQYGYAFKRIEKEHPDVKQFHVFEPSGSNYPLVFYKKTYNRLKQYDIAYIDSATLGNSPQLMLVLEEQMDKLKRSTGNLEVIFREKNCFFVRTKPGTMPLVE